MNLYELFVGQIPEAIYFALFMIFVKQFKTKRFAFIILTTIDYVLLLHALPYNTWSHVLFFVITFIVLKILYKEHVQVTDVFTLGIASLFMMITSIPIFLLFGPDMTVVSIVSRVVLFTLLFVLKNKLSNIQLLYKKFWNRNDKVSKKMKSTTFRALNTVSFNIMFFVINVCMIYVVLGGD